MNPLNLLVVSTLYPNNVQFRHGVFVETRIKQLMLSEQVKIRVIAPVAWFPVKSKWFPNYSKLTDIADHECRDTIEVYHPRYIVIPKVGMLLTPLFLAISIYRQVKKLQRQGYDFDVIDAHYYYPDGVAAALVAKWLNKPLTITARGSDINLIAEMPLPNRMIIWASKLASFNWSVSQALRQRMLEIGISEQNSGVARNGVDTVVFRPTVSEIPYLNNQYKVLLSVGNLVELKGHHLIIEALTALPDYQLIIVGGGELENQLKQQVKALALQHRVHFAGEIPQQQLPAIYSRADALILASSREGWPNVLLEAMACGTPVIATAVGGCPEIVQSPVAGILCKQRSVQGLTEAVEQLFADYPDPSMTRQYAETFSWHETTEQLLKLFTTIRQDTSTAQD